jgi:hypothetical protein
MVVNNGAVETLLNAGDSEHAFEELIGKMLKADSDPSTISKVADEIRVRADNMVPSVIDDLLGHKSAA